MMIDRVRAEAIFSAAALQRKPLLANLNLNPGGVDAEYTRLLEDVVKALRKRGLDVERKYEVMITLVELNSAALIPHGAENAISMANGDLDDQLRPVKKRR